MKNYFEYNGYIGTINMSVEDGVFFGTIHGINDLVTFEGESFQEVKDAFIEAVDDYLIFCEECGKEPEKIYKGQFNVRIAPELHRAMALEAVKQNESLNQIVERACDEYINKKECNCSLQNVMQKYLDKFNVDYNKWSGLNSTGGWNFTSTRPALRVINGGM